MTDIRYQPSSTAEYDDLPFREYEAGPNYALMGGAISGLALLGLLLSSRDEVKMALADLGLGPKSWRRKRGLAAWLDSLSSYRPDEAARAVGQTVDKARPYVAGSTQTINEAVVPTLADYASRAARWLTESGDTVKRQVADQAPQVGKTASEYAAQTGRYAMNLGASLYDRLPDTSALKDLGAQKAAEGYELASQLGKKGTEYATEYGSVGADYATEYGKKGARHARRFGKKGAAYAGDALTQGTSQATETAQSVAESVRGFSLGGMLGSLVSGLFSIVLLPPKLLFAATWWVFGLVFSLVWNFGWVGALGWVALVAYAPEQKQRDAILGQAKSVVDFASGFVGEMKG